MISGLNETISLKDEEISSCTETVADLNARLDSSENSLSDARRRIEFLTDEAAASSELISSLRKAVSDRDKTIETLKNEKDELSLQYENDKNELCGQIGSLSAEVQELQSENTKLRAQMDYKELPVDDLLSSVDDLIEPLKQYGYKIVAEPSLSLAAKVSVGEKIDRWGWSLHDTVRLREKPYRNSLLILNLKYHQHIYVFREELGADGEYWSYVSTGKKSGYVQSRYIELLSHEDSDEYQDKRNKPVPEP